MLWASLAQIVENLVNLPVMMTNILIFLRRHHLRYNTTRVTTMTENLTKKIDWIMRMVYHLSLYEPHSEIRFESLQREALKLMPNIEDEQREPHAD